MPIEEVVIEFVDRTKISKYLLVIIITMCIVILVTCLVTTALFSAELGGYLTVLWTMLTLIISFTLFSVIFIYTCINNCNHIALFIQMEDGVIMAMKIIDKTTCLKIPTEIKGLLKRKYNIPGND